MKASEFYEKYWMVDGKPAPPLTESEKSFLDEVWSSPVNSFKMEIKRKPSGEVVNIDLEGMEKQMISMSDAQRTER